MKKQPIPFLLILAFTTLFVSSCNKHKCSAGLGGDVTLVAFPQHHGLPILNKTSYLDTVYLKFNTQESPGNNLSSYDAYFVGEEGENHVHLTGLKCGDYYILAVGFDSTISQRVIGGMPYSFSQKSGEIDLNIAVTE